MMGSKNRKRKKFPKLCPVRKNVLKQIEGSEMK